MLLMWFCLKSFCSSGSVLMSFNKSNRIIKKTIEPDNNLEQSSMQYKATKLTMQ